MDISHTTSALIVKYESGLLHSRIVSPNLLFSV